MAGNRQGFQNNPELQRFVLHEVRATGRQLGVGSYGTVEELEVNGVVCAGKRLHEALLEQGNAGVADIARRYLLECQVMTEMRHPHIVQFLGLCFLEGSELPVLVMEQLDSSLDDLLETSPGLPLSLKLSLLTDVARGLVYLHTRNPPVVHRDLSARNVLLTSSLVAKISDLGNARIVNLEPGQLARTLTRIPGTLVYMPPESFDEGSRYGPQLDIFSFGHLALFTLTQVFPGTLHPHNYPDPDNPGRLLGRSEVERRTDYIQPLREQLGEQHPLLQLVCQCLHNTPDQRPSAEELLQQLEAARPQVDRTYGSKHVKVEIAKLQVTMMSVLRTRETEVGEKDNEIEHLRHDLQQVQDDRERLEVEAEAKDVQLQQQGTELQQNATRINRLTAVVRTLRGLGTKLPRVKGFLLQAERQRLQAEVEAKDTQVNRQQRILQTLRAERQRLQAERERLQAEVETKNAQVNRQQIILQTLRAGRQRLQAERERLQAEVETKDTQLQERDVEINRQQRELQTLRAEKERLQAEVEAKNARVNRQQRILQTLRVERQRLQTEVGAKNAQVNRQQRILQTVRAERERLQAEVEAKDTQLQEKDDHLQQQDTELQERDAQINRQRRELQTLREDKRRLQAEVEAKNTEIDSQQRRLQMLAQMVQEAVQIHQQKQTELQTLREEMDARSAQFQQQLRERDAEINRLQREMRIRDQSDESTVEMLSSQEGVQMSTPVMSSAGIHSSDEDTEGELSLVISIPRQL